MKKNLLNIANILSFSRILFGLIFLWLFYIYKYTHQSEITILNLKIILINEVGFTINEYKSKQIFLSIYGILSITDLFICVHTNVISDCGNEFLKSRSIGISKSESPIAANFRTIIFWILWIGSLFLLLNIERNISRGMPKYLSINLNIALCCIN